MEYFFFFNQKTSYDMRISDWSSDVCSSDLGPRFLRVTSRGQPSGADVASEESGQIARWRLFDLEHGLPRLPASQAERSEERRVGKECVSTCRSRWSPYH